MIACEAGHSELIELIISYDPKLLYDCSTETGTPLHAAITGQKPEDAVQCLLNRFDEDFKLKEMVNKKDMSGVHPLFLSCFSGNFEVT